MKYYTVLYTMSAPNPYGAIKTPYLIGMCGDRSHFQLDGRNTLTTMHQDAREWAIKHKATAYRIERGDNLLHLQPYTDMVCI